MDFPEVATTEPQNKASYVYLYDVGHLPIRVRGGRLTRVWAEVCCFGNQLLNIELLQMGWRLKSWNCFRWVG